MSRARRVAASATRDIGLPGGWRGRHEQPGGDHARIATMNRLSGPREGDRGSWNRDLARDASPGAAQIDCRSGDSISFLGPSEHRRGCGSQWQRSNASLPNRVCVSSGGRDPHPTAPRDPDSATESAPATVSETVAAAVAGPVTGTRLPGRGHAWPPPGLFLKERVAAGESDVKGKTSRRGGDP